MDILIATNNRHKVEEISSLIASQGFTVKSFVDFPDLPKTI